MTTIGRRLSNDDGHSNDNGKETPIGLDNKTTTLQVHHAFFVLFLAVVARLTNETSSSRARITAWANITQKVSFSFSKLTYGPFGLNLENFANNQRQIK